MRLLNTIMPLSLHELIPSLGSNTGGPIGSVYQPTAYFPQRNPAINHMGAIPAVSNYGAQAFPVNVWDKSKDYGNPLDAINGGTVNVPPAK